MRNQNVVIPKIQDIWVRSQAILDEGIYYVATNPTPALGISLTTSLTVETQTSPTMLIMNSWSVADPNAKNIYPLSLKMLCTAQGTAGMSYWRGTIRTDINNPLKYTSGGSQLIPQSLGINSEPSMALIYFGAITALAQTNGGKLVSNFLISAGGMVAEDVHILEWGVATLPGQSLAQSAGSKVVKSIAVPAMVIPPGGWLALHTWGSTNTTAPAFELEFQYVER